MPYRSDDERRSLVSDGVHDASRRKEERTGFNHAAVESRPSGICKLLGPHHDEGGKKRNTRKKIILPDLSPHSRLFLDGSWLTIAWYPVLISRFIEDSVSRRRKNRTSRSSSMLRRAIFPFRSRDSSDKNTSAFVQRGGRWVGNQRYLSFNPQKDAIRGRRRELYGGICRAKLREISNSLPPIVRGRRGRSYLYFFWPFLDVQGGYVIINATRAASVRPSKRRSYIKGFRCRIAARACGGGSANPPRKHDARYIRRSTEFRTAAVLPRGAIGPDRGNEIADRRPAIHRRFPGDNGSNTRGRKRLGISRTRSPRRPRTLASLLITDVSDDALGDPPAISSAHSLGTGKLARDHRRSSVAADRTLFAQVIPLAYSFGRYRPSPPLSLSLRPLGDHSPPPPVGGAPSGVFLRTWPREGEREGRR